MTETVKKKKATPLVSPNAEEPLPPGWSAHQSRSNPGLLYYFNCRTGATTWNRSEVTDVAAGWGVHTRYIAKSPMAAIKQEPENGDVECKDMVLLGLKLDSTETHVREYFKDVEVLGVQMMQSRDNLTKYAIIKFSDWEVAKVLGRHKHSINGTLCSLQQAMESPNADLAIGSHNADLAMKSLKADLAIESLKADPTIESLKADLAKLKEDLRKTKIEKEVAKYNNKATKRNIRHGMEALNKLEDIESTWAPLLTTAADGVVITADNIPQANQAVEDMTNTIKVLKEKERMFLEKNLKAAKAASGKVTPKKKKNPWVKGIAMPPPKKTKKDKCLPKLIVSISHLGI